MLPDAGWGTSKWRTCEGSPKHSLHAGDGGWCDKLRMDGCRYCWYDWGVSERIAQPRLAIETMHHCNASHEASTPIMETLRGQKVWAGVVESFTLTGHRKAKRCYAWSYQDNGETQYVTALEIPPVELPITMVRATITADTRRKKWAIRISCS